jgi:hypothetical protein
MTDLESAMAKLEAKLERLDGRLAAIERAMTAFARQPGLLIGWRAIGAYMRKAPATVRNYARWGLPATRLGRHRVSSPALIDSWLLVRERRRVEQKERMAGRNGTGRIPPSQRKQSRRRPGRPAVGTAA